MAEGLAIASGSAGILSLGIQVAENIKKVYDLYGRFKDAPNQISSLISEVDNLANVLEEYQTISRPEQTTSSTTTSWSLDDAISACAEARQELASLLQSLDEDIRHGRSWKRSAKARSRFALSEKKIDAMLHRIERAKSTVMPGIAIDQSLLQAQQLGRIESSLQSLQTSAHFSQQQILLLLQESSERIPSATRVDDLDLNAVAVFSQQLDGSTAMHGKRRSSKSLKKHTHLSPVCTQGAGARRVDVHRWWLFLGSLEVTHQDDCQDEHSPDTSCVASSKHRLLFPPWLLNLSIALITRRSFGHISVSLAAQRLVPADAEIFRLCALGKTAAVQELIAAGRASVHDASHEGVTPLTVAAACRRAETCRMLLNAGADASVTFFNRRSDGTTFEINILACSFKQLHLPHTFLSVCYLTSDVIEDSIREVLQVITGNSDLDASDECLRSRKGAVQLGTWNAAQQISTSLADFLWLTAPTRIGLMGEDLEKFYIEVFLQQCRNATFEQEGTAIIYAAFSLIKDVRRLAAFRWESGSSALHLLFCCMLVPDLDKEQIARLITALTENGADVHAVMYVASNISPLIYGCADLLNVTLDRASEFHPEHIIDRLEDAIRFWLEILLSASVDLHAYICRERELGVNSRVCLETPYNSQFEDQFIDKDWYVEVDFLYPEDKAQSLKPEDISIEVNMFSEKRAYDIPGAWSTDSDGVSQTSEFSDDDSQPDHEVRSEDGNRPFVVDHEDVNDAGTRIYKRRNSI